MTFEPQSIEPFSVESPANPRAHDDSVPGFSNAQPLWKFLLLFTLTFGLYTIYWYYRNLRQLKEHEELDIRPGWRTVGLFVPILNIALMIEHFSFVRVAAGKSGVTRLFSTEAVAVIYIALCVIPGFLPDPFCLIGLLYVVPLAIVQRSLNDYWRTKQPSLIVKQRFTGGERVLVALVGIALLVFLGGLVFVPESFFDQQTSNPESTFIDA